MLVRAGKFLLFAAGSFALGFMAIVMADSIAPQRNFGLGVLAASTLFLGIFFTAFGGGRVAGLAGAAKPRRFPYEEEPLIGCPTCHSEMHLLGTNGRQGQARLYLWACEKDHGWSRQGESPADATHPWQPCNAAEMVGVFFG